MKKIQKGNPGYLNYKKKVEIIRTIVYFAIVFAILALGIWQTGTRLNLLTVVAILGCLPASKSLVGVIARFPYPSIDPDKAKEIAKLSRHLTVCYDTVIIALSFQDTIFTDIRIMRKSIRTNLRNTSAPFLMTTSIPA